MAPLSRRKLLFGFAGGSALIMGGDTAAAIADAKRPDGVPDGRPRIGTVVAVNGSVVSVHVGGGVLQDMPYLLGTQITAGDDVAIMQIGSTWYVVGPFAGIPKNNLVVNGSFEDDAGNASTTGWDFQVVQNTAGTPSWDIADASFVTAGDFVAGSQAAIIDCSTNGAGAISEGKLRSAAIPVVAGEQYSGVVSTAGFAFPSTLPVNGAVAILPTIQVIVAIEYYTGPTDTTSTGAAQYNPLPQPPQYRYMLVRTPIAVIPPGVNYIRLTLDFYANDTGANQYFEYFDRAIVRKIRNADGSLALTS